MVPLGLDALPGGIQIDLVDENCSVERIDFVGICCLDLSFQLTRILIDSDFHVPGPVSCLG